jgi:hypothetical protein
MRRMLTESRIPRPLFSLAKRLLIVAALALSFVAIRPAHADGRYICSVKQDDGSTWWVSCGSSAGSFVYRCDPDPNNPGSNQCGDCDTPQCNDYASSYCAMGSCQTDPGDGGGGGVAPVL